MPRFQVKYVANMEDHETLTEVKEGSAVVLYPASESVFYNPVQQFNRDLSILAIKQFLVIYKREYGSRMDASSKMGKGINGAKKITEKHGDTVAEEECNRIDNSVPNKKVEKDFLGHGDGEDAEGKLEGFGTKCKPIRVLEGLAATGLRSIRYALEIDGIDQIIANDFSAVAHENIKRNIEHNSVANIIEPSLCDAG